MENPSEASACQARIPSRRKRVVTEARKEQNRIAQRAYRQRQREERLKKPRPEKAPRYPNLRPLPTLQEPPAPTDASDPTPVFPSDIPWHDPDPLGRIDAATAETSDLPSVPDLSAQSNADLSNTVGMDPLCTLELVVGGEGDISDRANPVSDQQLLVEGMPGADLDVIELAEDEAWDGGTQPAPADLYLNRLQFSKSSLLQACFLNARCLGISIEEFSSYSCLSFCSPFYRPVTMTQDPKALLAAVSRPSIPPHLQPTLPQVLFPHHPILDLLPLPELRARAITLAATAPFLLDVFDFKQDLVEGGLICWSARRGGNSQPWDKRSWEAAPWFLRKWRLLVDGPQSDLWQQSAWWQGSRGEVSAL